MAAHYGMGILPARPGKARDDAKGEAEVRFAQTDILGRPCRQTFFCARRWRASLGVRPQTTQGWVVTYRQCSLSRSLIALAEARRPRPGDFAGRMTETAAEASIASMRTSPREGAAAYPSEASTSLSFAGPL
jgi:hypothetical protein